MWSSACLEAQENVLLLVFATGSFIALLYLPYSLRFACGLDVLLRYSNIDDVDKTMDEIDEQTENMKQIQEALLAPIGAAADFDEA
ncbi:hypothetical protein L1987_09123 [Smallanthus sonchifolius]|uniref:Uncharacterized protein n=1 Tax=Smallanthus sonchifolius TaxID=185202 RepID=A0ACB9JPD2_9ASTR|nr:hypothetical protein L1987_09123 [Smallanthus sonchifolius]